MHVIIRVGTTHHGCLKPGTPFLTNVECSRGPAIGDQISFPNPEGGHSFGTVLSFLTAEQESVIHTEG